MRISLTTVYVDDQDQALRFYTEVLGFVKKADFAKNDNPPAKVKDGVGNLLQITQLKGW